MSLMEEPAVYRGYQASRANGKKERIDKATAKVHLGEASHAAKALTAAQLAPGSSATLAALSDPERRPPEPSAPLSPDVENFQSAASLPFDREAFLINLRSSSRGAAGDMSGTKNEHLKVCLELEETAQLLADAAQHLARAEVPSAVVQAIITARAPYCSQEARRRSTRHCYWRGAAALGRQDPGPTV